MKAHKMMVPICSQKRSLKIFKVIGITILSVFVWGMVLSLFPSLQVSAKGFIEDTSGTVANFTKYPIWNYSLDFYVNKSGDWLPWNWGDSVGKSVFFGVYCLTNLLWMLSALISYFVGILVQQAYSLDFITVTIDYVALNVQKIAGVSSAGFSNRGLLPSFLPILLLIAGGLFLYRGVVKRELSKAISGLTVFIATLVIGMGTIAYSSDYLGMVNTFQKEFNTEVLNIGTELTLGESGTDLDPVDAIRESLFNVQVKIPYLLLQYGNTEIEEIGEERVDELLSQSPANSAEDREKVIKEEVENRENVNMGVSYVIERYVMVQFILILNIIISVCVGILSSFMLVTQVLFTLFVCFFPVALVFSLFPGGERLLVKVVEKIFNVLFHRAGITLLLTIAFSLSSLAYRISADKGGFLFMMFLQVVIFVTVVMKADELLGFMRLGSQENKHVKGGVGRAVRTIASIAMLGKMKAVNGGGIQKSVVAQGAQGTQPNNGFSGGGKMPLKGNQNVNRDTVAINGESSKKQKNETIKSDKKFQKDASQTINEHGYRQQKRQDVDEKRRVAQEVKRFSKENSGNSRNGEKDNSHARMEERRTQARERLRERNAVKQRQSSKDNNSALVSKALEVERNVQNSRASGVKVNNASKRFNNFSGRKYRDIDMLERALLDSDNCDEDD